MSTWKANLGKGLLIAASVPVVIGLGLAGESDFQDAKNGNQEHNGYMTQEMNKREADATRAKGLENITHEGLRKAMKEWASKVGEKAAIHHLQIAAGMNSKNTPVYGPNTKEKVDSSIIAFLNDETVPSQMRAKLVGDIAIQGPEESVKNLQIYLNTMRYKKVKVDGSLGKETKAGVTEYVKKINEQIKLKKRSSGILKRHPVGKTPNLKRARGGRVIGTATPQ